MEKNTCLNSKPLNMKKFILLLLIPAALFSCAKIKVQGMADAEYKNTNGLMYKLPQTCIVFNITVKTTTYTKSECFKTNIKKIPLTVNQDIVKKLDSTGDFSVRKITAIEFVTTPVDDPDKYFLVETNKKAFQDRTYGVTLSNQGFMTNSTMEAKDNTFDVVTQLASSAASFISPMVKRAPDDNTRKTLCETLAADFTQLQNDKFEFFQLKRQAIGSPLPSADLYQKVMDEYGKTEIELFNNAFFSTEIEKNSCIIYFTPNKSVSEIKEDIFFSYDPVTDIITINQDLPGKITFQNNGVTDIKYAAKGNITVDNKVRRLTILPEEMSQLVTNRMNNFADNDAAGLRYNIPRQCVLSLSRHGSSPSVRGTLQLPQWGTVGRVNDRMSKITVVLNPETGALLSATLESKGITAEQIKNAMTAAESFRDLVVRDKDAEALAKMEKKIKMLETKDKLDNLQEGEATELIALRKESELLAEKKKVAELKKALKELEQE